MTLQELHDIAAQVRELGFREIEVKEQPEPGIQAGNYFFTATELDSVLSRHFFVNGMFEAIVSRREKPPHTAKLAPKGE